MATLSFSCPKCQRAFKNVKAEMSGSKVKCQCGHIFRLGPKKTKPEQSKRKQPSKPPAKPNAKAKPRPATQRPTGSSTGSTSPPTAAPKRPAQPQPSAAMEEPLIADRPRSSHAPVASEPMASSASPTPSSPTQPHDPDVDELIAIAGVPTPRPTQPPANIENLNSDVSDSDFSDSDSFDGLDDHDLNLELDLPISSASTTSGSSSTSGSDVARSTPSTHDSADDLLPVDDAPTPAPAAKANRTPASRPSVGSRINLKKKTSVGHEDDLELLDDDVVLDDDLELLDDDLELLDDGDELTLEPLPSAYAQPGAMPSLAPGPSPYAAPAANNFAPPMPSAQPMAGGLPQAAPMTQPPNAFGNPYAPVGPTLQPGYASGPRYPSWVITAPGIGLIVCGAIDVVWVLLMLIRTFVLGVGATALPQPEFAPVGEPEKEFIITVMIFSAAISLILLAIALTVLMGGINMVRRTGYGRAVAGAVCAILPCAILDVLVLEIGIGIWAMVVLCMEGYRRQFD